MKQNIHTLDDFLSSDLEIISVGLNPSLISAREGFYFANPRNRFWKALNASGLIAEQLTPGQSAQQTLLDRDRIGFTDVVKRPSSMGSDLRMHDYREWVPVLHEKLLRLQPRIVWFHGKVAYGKYLKLVDNVGGVLQWGEQQTTIGTAHVFVTPNPSPANAVYSLQDITEWYQRLARFRDTL